MFKSKLFISFCAGAVFLSACLGPLSRENLQPGPDSRNGIPGNQSQPAVQQGGIDPAAVKPDSAPESNDVHSDAEHHSDVDLTHLELGDGKVSTSPRVGYVYSCMTSFNGSGAQGTGDWMNGDGTWDATKKAVVDGSVTWPSSFNVSLQDGLRIFSGNDLPNHPTGSFPISQSDDAFAVDRNPNSIQSQSITLSLPANPTAAAQPNCVGGEVGIMLSGVVIFSAFDAEGRDAVAHEVQDECDGHPQSSGFYHYHSLSDCIVDTSTSGHSSLVGYAFDGYGIYGYYGEDGEELTNEDLDECHGHTHIIEWDGQMVMMYHYHATHEFPYVVGCFRGTPAVRALSGPQDGAVGGGQPQQNAGQNQPQVGSQQNQGQAGGQANGQQPPQTAIDACVNTAVNSACMIDTPNGTLNGTCQPVQNSIVACVPAGGPQGP